MLCMYCRYFTCQCDAGVTGQLCDQTVFFADTKLEIREENSSFDHQISLAVEDNQQDNSHNVRLHNSV